MRISKFVTSLAALGLVSVALAGDKSHTSIAIVVDDGDENVRIELDSDQMGFDLHDMQVGENRSVVDKDGRTILVTRNADGFSFDVDGKSIDVPIAHSEHATADVIVHSDHSEVVDVQVMSSPGGMTVDALDTTMVLTAKPVDAATQQAIRSLLESSGHTGSVHFVDRQTALNNSNLMD